MSHLVLRRINGKWRMFNKHTKKVEGRAFEHKEEAAIETHKQDIKEDKQIDKGEEQEHKEHPEFSKKSAKQIAIDHIKEHPDMYKKGKGGSGEEDTRPPKHEHKYDRKGMCIHCGKQYHTGPQKDEEEYGDAPSEEVYTGRHTEGHHGVGRGSGGFAKKCKKCHEHPRLANEDYCIDCLSQEDLDRHMAERNVNEYLDERKHRGWMERGGEPEEAGEGRGSGGSDNSLKLLHEYNALVRGMEQTMDEKTLEDYSRRLTKVRRTLVKRHGDIPSWEEAEGRGSGKILNPYDKEAIMGRGADDSRVRELRNDLVRYRQQLDDLYSPSATDEDRGMMRQIQREISSTADRIRAIGGEPYDDPRLQATIKRNRKMMEKRGRGSDMGNMTYPKITSGYKLHDGPNVTSGGRMHKTASHGGKGGDFSEGDKVSYIRNGKHLTGKIRGRILPGDKHAVINVDQTMTAGGVPIGRLERVSLHELKKEGRGSGKIMNPYDKDYVLGRGGDEHPNMSKATHPHQWEIDSYLERANCKHEYKNGVCPKCGHREGTEIKPSMGRGGNRPPMNLHLKEGALHKMEGVPQGKKMPASKLEIHEGDTPLEKKRKQFAINAKSWHHGGGEGRGGDHIQDVIENRKKYGTSYMLPNGKMVRLAPDELKRYMIANKLKLHTPSHQGSSEEEEQVGIKHS